jgi:Flp pilus assembly protein TadD
MTEAERNYKSAIKLTPNDSKPNNNYAMLLENQGREKEAETHYKKAIELNPKSIAARNNFANLLRKKQRFSEAESEMRIALELDPDNAYLLGTFGDILADEGNFQEAERILRKALFAFNSIEQNAISQIHNSLGSVYGELKEYNKAKREFIRAIGFDYQNVKAIRNLRKVNALLGEESKSFPSKMFKNVKSVTLGPTGIGITFERESINQMIPSKTTIAINLER